MKVVEHLTKEQLAGYAAQSLKGAEEAGEIGRHLLQCADCRKLLPAPTTKQFWSALMDETEIGENLKIEKSSFSEIPRFLMVFSFFRQPQTLAWSAGALLIIASFSFMIWSSASRQSDSGRELAQKVETEKIENNLPTDEKLPISTGEIVSTVDRPEHPQQPPRPKQPNNNLLPVTEGVQKTTNTENRELALLLENTPPAVSSLRPNNEVILRGKPDDNPKPAKTFDLIGPVGETVLETTPQFRWAKEDNARSYRISILDSNFNEVLTAEVSENSFKPAKPLKRGAKYLWRVAANTDKGEIIAPLPPQPPAMFRIAEEKAESRIESLKKKESDRFKLAVFYAKGGMLDSAACTLKEILAKNSKYNAARRLLAKVEQWKKENQTTTQRCGPPTETKADQ